MIMDSLHHGFELGYLMIQQFAVYLTNFSEKLTFTKGIDQTHHKMGHFPCPSQFLFFSQSCRTTLPQIASNFCLKPPICQPSALLAYYVIGRT